MSDQGPTLGPDRLINKLFPSPFHFQIDCRGLMMKVKTKFLVGIIALMGIGTAFFSLQSIKENTTKTLKQTVQKGKGAGSELKTPGNNTGGIQADTQPTSQNLHKVHTFKNLGEYEKISKYGKFPGLLQGTNMHYKLPFDADGNLIVTYELRDLFEFFLNPTAAIGEAGENMATAVGRIREFIELTLPSPAASRALKILDDYLKYRTSLAQWASQTENSQSSEENKAAFVAEVKKAFDEKKNLRRKYLDPEVADIFFRDEEAYDNYTGRLMEININDSLDEKQKDEMLAKIEDQLPEISKALVRYKREERKLKKQIEELKSQKGNADKIYQLRKEFYGGEIADRYAYVEDHSTEWDSRVEHYLQLKKEISNEPNLTNEEKDVRVRTAKEGLFEEDEQTKLVYYELTKELAEKRQKAQEEKQKVQKIGKSVEG